jgi:glutamyl-tRNA reductase
LDPCVYIKSGHHAVKHLFEVACGLDSMAVGETQILGQIRNAYCIADEAESTGAIINTLFQRAINVGKRARTETGISCGAFSIGAAAVQLAKTVFGKLDGRKALLLGAGDMSKLAATHLQANGVSKTYVASRTKSRVDDLVAQTSGEAIEFGQVEEVMREVDFMISSTSAPRPIITKERMSRVMKSRGSSPIFLIDIAVPRDIAPDVRELENVFVYNIDDLHFFLDRCRREREAEIDKVRTIIDDETAAFMTYLRTHEALPLIKQLRAKFDSVYLGEWERYSSNLEHLAEEDQEYVRKMLRSVVRKLTHDPILRIKRYAANEQEKDKLEVARELFGLSASDRTSEKGTIPKDL